MLKLHVRKKLLQSISPQLCVTLGVLLHILGVAQGKGGCFGMTQRVYDRTILKPILLCSEEDQSFIESNRRIVMSNVSAYAISCRCQNIHANL